MKYDKKDQMRVWDSIAEGWAGWRNTVRKDVIEFSKDWKPGKILDIGCGSGRNLYYFAERGFDWYGIDFSKEMIKQAKENFKRKGIRTNDKNGKDRLIVADMTEIPFEDEAFDYCISIASFHHLPKRLHEKGLEEIKRILKPGGECILSVWNKYSFAQPGFWFSPKEKFIPWKRKEKSGSVKAHERYYYLFDWFEITSLVRKNGFQIKKATDFFAENITLLLKKA